MIHQIIGFYTNYFIPYKSRKFDKSSLEIGDDAMVFVDEGDDATVFADEGDDATEFADEGDETVDESGEEVSMLSRFSKTEGKLKNL
jgi:hypothetical protein